MTRLMNGITSDYIGAMCADFRKYKLKQTQKEVAKTCDVSREAVSKFERGKLGNSCVFFYYIKMGLLDWCPIDRWNGWNGF